MSIKNSLSQLNLISQCKKYGLGLWQCPQFLFLVMGTIICLTSLISFVIGTHYQEDPTIVAFIVLMIAIVLLIISYLIIRSFERLAETNRMKSEFISVVSHQLRSPISNLNWALEFLLSGRIGKTDEKQLEYFKILKENTSRMRELVSDLLIVSRIESATLPLKKEDFSIIKLIEGTFKEFEPFAKASNVELKFEYEKGTEKIFADPNQIGQVIKNFMDNAIRYVEKKGEVKVTLKKKGENLYFEIKDIGVGIPKEDQKYIFQKFFRSKNALRYQTQGSGLGLFIAKSIIEKSGGKIGFKSEEGKGTIFWFVIPINNKS